jgi:opacity protein-like surface antigen
MLIGLSTLSFAAIAQNNIYSPQGNQANNSKGFGGFYTQIGLGFQSFSPNYSNSNYTVSGTRYGSSTQVSSTQGLGGTVTAGYDFTINPSFLLGLGAELSPVASKSSSIGGATVGGVSIPASSYKINNSYNIFVSPMFPVDKTTAVYGKVGYGKANISSGPNLDSLGYSGYSVGLGYKTIVSGNLFAYIEGNYFNYGKVNDSGTAITPGSTPTSYSYSNSSTATSYNLLYGVGIRF